MFLDKLQLEPNSLLIKAVGVNTIEGKSVIGGDWKTYQYIPTVRNLGEVMKTSSEETRYAVGCYVILNNPGPWPSINVDGTSYHFISTEFVLATIWNE